MRFAAVAAVTLAALAVGACESTQDKSARLARNAHSLLSARGLSVTKTNPQVKVLQTIALHDANGTAAVVSLRNAGDRSQAQLPIAIAVSGSSGEPEFKNDTAGLEQSLIKMPLVAGHETTFWINDQVTGPSDPRRVDARVGLAEAPSPKTVPRIVILNTRLTIDSVNGPELVGVARNNSKIVQNRLVIYCVARRSGRIVAAGRAVIPKLAPAPTPKPARFTMFFIGNPKGARLELRAPPTTLG